MHVSSESESTSVSLLRRVRRQDGAAWERFCEVYGPVVYGWCRRLNLQDSDAADAVQDVFQSVFRNIDNFEKDAKGLPGAASGTFRGWLWTVTRNQVRLHYRKQNRVPRAVGGTDAGQQWADVSQTWDDLSEDDVPEPDPGATRRWIVQRALELLREDFSPGTWDVFTRIALQDQSPQRVAEELGLTENAVRQAKFRVLRRLREELDGQL